MVGVELGIELTAGFELGVSELFVGPEGESGPGAGGLNIVGKLVEAGGSTGRKIVNSHKRTGRFLSTAAFSLPSSCLRAGVCSKTLSRKLWENATPGSCCSSFCSFRALVPRPRIEFSPPPSSSASVSCSAIRGNHKSFQLIFMLVSCVFLLVLVFERIV